MMCRFDITKRDDSNTSDMWNNNDGQGMQVRAINDNWNYVSDTHDGTTPSSDPAEGYFCIGGSGTTGTDQSWSNPSDAVAASGQYGILIAMNGLITDDDANLLAIWISRYYHSHPPYALSTGSTN
jgi:hypothetical protein